MKTGHDIAREAVRLAGRKFEHQGRSTAGVDCAGLVWLAARNAGFTLPDVRNYGTSASMQDVTDNLNRIALPIAWRDLDGGDVLVFALAGNSPHLGVFVDRVGQPPQIRCVRAMGGGRRGRVVFGPLTESLRNAVDSVWRLREVAAQRAF